MILVLEYPRCSTCKKALQWLRDNGVAFEDRHIVEQNPTQQELTEWYHKSGLPLKRFFNTSGNLYKEQGLKDKLPGMSEEERQMAIDRLEEQMLAAAGNLDFEKAAKLRDQMLALRGEKPLATNEKSRLTRRRRKK